MNPAMNEPLECSAASADERIFDLEYIERRDFRLDLKLIALSFWITFRGRWEIRGKKV